MRISSPLRWFKYLRFILALCIIANFAHSQNANDYRALDFYAVTVDTTPVAAVTGAANGCSIISTVDLVIDAVNSAGTTGSSTSQILLAYAPYQCGRLKTGAVISVNCLGGGLCGWQGMRW